MSTVDPLERDRATGRRVLWWTLTCLFAALCGYGCSIFGDFPGGSASFGLDSSGPVVKALLAAFAPIGAILGFGVLVRLPGRPGLFGEQAFMGATAVAAFAAGLMIGTLLPGTFAEFADTDLSAKLAAIRVLGGGVLLGAGLLVVWAAHRVRRRQRTAELRRTGIHVLAEVTELHDTGGTTNNAPVVRLTVAFTDTAGTRRYVRRRILLNRLERYGTGDRVDLWYDGRHPSDERRIVIGQAPEDS